MHSIGNLIEMFLPVMDQSAVDDSAERWMDQIKESTDYVAWFCDHWHTDKRNKGKDTAGTSTCTLHGYCSSAHTDHACPYSSLAERSRE